MPVRRICDNCQHFGIIMDCWACHKHKRMVADSDTCPDWKMKSPHPPCRVQVRLLSGVLRILGGGLMPRDLFYYFVFEDVDDELRREELEEDVIRNNPPGCYWVNARDFLLIRRFGTSRDAFLKFRAFRDNLNSDHYLSWMAKARFAKVRRDAGVF